MAETLPAKAFNIAASEGKVLLEAPGIAATITVETASYLSDELLAASSAARLQERQAITQALNVP